MLASKLAVLLPFSLALPYCLSGLDVAHDTGKFGTSLDFRGDANSVQVLGVGLSRTATQSLALALKMLGFKTLHAEGFHPEMPLGRDNNLTDVVTRAATQYFETGNFEALSPALQLVNNMGVEALVDLPWSACTSALVQAYPNAKVIVTVRDSAETWYRSYWEHFRWASWFPPGLVHPFIKYWRYVAAQNGCGYVTDWPPRLPTARERAKCLGAYDQRVEHLRRIVSPSNLLVFNVKEGWEPLCRFLGVQAPDTPFPRHDSYAFLHWHGDIYTFVAVFYLVHLALFSACTCCLMACTGHRLPWKPTPEKEKAT